MRIPARGLTPYMQVQKLKDQDQVQDRDPHLSCHAAKGMQLCVPALGHLGHTHLQRAYAAAKGMLLCVPALGHLGHTPLQRVRRLG